MWARRFKCKCLGFWLIGLILAMQWMLLAHACGPLAQLPGDVAAVAAHAGCEGAPTDADQATERSLCKAHCTDAGKLPSHIAAAQAAAPTLGWFVVNEPYVAACESPRLGFEVPQANGLPRGAPPLYLSLLVLRN